MEPNIADIQGSLNNFDRILVFAFFGAVILSVVGGFFLGKAIAPKSAWLFAVILPILIAVAYVVIRAQQPAATHYSIQSDEKGERSVVVSHPLEAEPKEHGDD